jgi:hypothetical protein
LSRTPASAGNRRTWTWAGWVKRSAISSASIQTLFGVYASGGATYHNLNFGTDNKIVVYDTSGVTTFVTTQVFRDPSAWFHIVLARDTTQATASNRVKIYVNGIQVTTFDSTSYPAQNSDGEINSTAQHNIGSSLPFDGRYFSGYLADIHFIDGQALDPTSFGEFDATTGVWVPIEYTGTYGTNGFKLDFSDNSSNTATTLGKDTSPNGNNWTPNNLSVTAGAGNDSLVDVPTNGDQTDTGAGGEVRGNYCTWNALQSGMTLTNGNLDANSTVNRKCLSTIGMASGKWYCEITQGVTGNNSGLIGLSQGNVNLNSYTGADAVSYGYFAFNGDKYTNGSASSYGSSYTTGDIIGIAFDADAGVLTFYKNGVSQGVAFSGLTSGPYFFSVSNSTTTSNQSLTSANFGQRSFVYTAPSGFKALNTANLPAPVVTKPSEVMDVALYTGNNTARSITGLGFSPDFVWIKGRSGSTDHALYDIVRGVEKDLVSNSTAAETTQTTGLTAFNSDGFSIGTLAKLNTNAATYAAWTWDAGSSTVTNTDGSISSQVRANASAGFSVVTWTGVNNGTVGHGLGVAPSFIIAKSRTLSYDWVCYHKDLGSSKYLYLNSTSAGDVFTNYWGTVSATTFLGNSQTDFYNNGGDMVAYCFAPVAGYSAFGSYTGNGSADGSFVYTSHLPKLILIKRTDTTSNWTILDTSRLGYNVDNNPLFPNLSNAEATTDLLDITSNGFKLRSTDASVNASGGTYIYASWASSPFNYSRAR